MLGGFLKRRGIAICLAFCALALAMGTSQLVQSAGELKLALTDVDGETDGIRALKISGVVRDGSTGFSYSFARRGADGSERVRFDPWGRDPDSRPSLWPGFGATEVTLKPAGDVREEIVRIPYETDDGEEFYLEKRLYSDVYEVIPRIPNYWIPVRLEAGAGKLYFSGTADAYVYHALIEEEEDSEGAFPMDTHLDAYTRWTQLPGWVEIGNTIYFAPSFDGLYGHTAVYAFDDPGSLDLGYAEDYPARTVFPIELEKDLDEVCGFLTCGDALLLAVRHGQQMELTKILPAPADGKYPSASIPASLDFTEPLTDGSRMLFYSRSGVGEGVSYSVLDTGRMLVEAEGTNVRIGAKAETPYAPEPRAFCLEGGVLYVASLSMLPRTEFFDYRNRLYITALDPEGAHLGCAELSAGLEDDPHIPNEDGDRYWGEIRRLESLTLGGNADA
jgi:uncharacterized protein (UPF0216 family)